MTPHDKSENVQEVVPPNQLPDSELAALRADIKDLRGALKTNANSRPWTFFTITVPVLLTSILAGATWYVQTTSQRKYDAYLKASADDREANKSHIEMITEVNRQVMIVIIAYDDFEKNGDTSPVSKSLQDFYMFVQQVRPQLQRLPPEMVRAIEGFTSDIERWRQFSAKAGSRSITTEQIVRYKALKGRAETLYKTLNSASP